MSPSTPLRSLLLVAPLVATVAAACSPGRDEPSAEDLDGDRHPLGQPWRLLTLVVRNIDVDYVDGQGQPRHLSRSMTADEEAAIAAAAYEVPGLVYAWSGGQGEATMDVVAVDEPLRRVSLLGPNEYWVGPEDLGGIFDAYVRDAGYDSVFVVWSPGDENQAVPVCCYYGYWIDVGAQDVTYAALHPSANGEAFVHEWLHGAGGFYRDVVGVDVPDPHDNALFGFPNPDANGSWAGWYTALLSGQLVKDGRPHGYVPEVWEGARPSGSPFGGAPSDPTPDGVRPSVRRAEVVDGDWIYLEWNRVEAAGEYTWFTIDVAERDVKVVVISPGDRVEPSSGGSAADGQKIAAYSMWGVAGAATVVAVVTGALFLVDWPTYQEDCAGGEEFCTGREGFELQGRLEALGIANTVAWVVGAAALGTGLVLYFTAPASPAEATAGLRVGPTSAALVVPF